MDAPAMSHAGSSPDFQFAFKTASREEGFLLGTVSLSENNDYPYSLRSPPWFHS